MSSENVCLFLARNFRKGRSDQSMNVHLNLTGALFSLHLFFLLSVLWVEVGLAQGQDGGVGGVICQSLGLLLHYSLLATFTWTAIEGFHLYLLLVRVFNVYIKRYLLKLALIGWGEFCLQYLYQKIPAHPVPTPGLPWFWWPIVLTW